MKAITTTALAEQMARIASVFRAANEGIREAAVEHRMVERFPVICECADPACREIFQLGVAEYEQVRAVPEQGLAGIGHDDPSVERIVTQNDRFLVTAKFGRAGEVHRENDPRS